MQQGMLIRFFGKSLSQAKKEKKMSCSFFAHGVAGARKWKKSEFRRSKASIDKNYITTYVSVQERGENIKKYENQMDRI